MPYIEELAKRHDVTVIVPFIAYESREMMGWGKFETSKAVRLIVSPTDEEVQNLFEEPYEGRTVALFSGISAFRDVKPWFLISLDYPVERASITEAPYTFKYPLWMHKLRFLIQDMKYVKYVKYVFAIGRGCQDYYRTWSSQWRVVPFAYCVGDISLDGTKSDAPAGNAIDEKLTADASADNSQKAQFCFVGSLDRRKNVMTILKAFAYFRHKHESAFRQCHLTIVGDGPLKGKLEKYVEDNRLTDNVTFTGILPMSAARRVIAQSHALLLPSLYDGWGAVVNEALTVGTMVYCSDTCGASVLVQDDPSRGCVFGCKDYEGLAKLFWNNYGFFLDAKQFAHRRQSIRQWAAEHIGPEAIARRMEKALKA